MRDEVRSHECCLAGRGRGHGLRAVVVLVGRRAGRRRAATLDRFYSVQQRHGRHDGRTQCGAERGFPAGGSSVVEPACPRTLAEFGGRSAEPGRSA